MRNLQCAAHDSEPSPALLEFWDSLPDDKREKWQSAYYSNQNFRNVINAVCAMTVEQLDGFVEVLS